MRTQEISFEGQTTIDVVLKADVIGLDEVVAVGYGSLKKSDVTGSVKSISAKDFNSGVVSTPEQLLTGKVAGVNIVTASGEPGGSVDINIRGVNSIGSGSSPLFVVDGVPIDAVDVSGTSVGGLGGSRAKNPLNFINPQDIESMTILKDASATAIYGTKAANGVILIETKKGKSGEGRVSFDSYVGISNVANRIDLLSADEYKKETARLGNLIGRDPDSYIDDPNADTDWQDEIYRTAISQNHNISFSGGKGKSNYSASIGYLDQQGVIKSTFHNKLTGRFNVGTTALNDRLSLQLNMTAARMNDEGQATAGSSTASGNLITSILRANPTSKPYLADGTLAPMAGTTTNPLAYLDLFRDVAQSKNLLSNFTAELTVLDGLTYKMNLGYQNSNVNRAARLIPNVDVGGEISVGNIALHRVDVETKLVENFLTYKKSFNNYKLTTLLGHSYQNTVNQGSFAKKSGLSTDEIDPIYNIGVGVNFDNLYSWYSERELQSFFGRLNFDIKDKYLFTASLRADGSSVFGENNRYGYFPSGAFAWRLSEENFIKNLNVFDNLKVRLGWGQTGNQAVPEKVTKGSYTSNLSTGYAFEGSTVVNGIVPARTPNPDLKWEVTTQSNIGLDFAILNSRVIGTVDYFKKVTTDLFLQIAAPAPSVISKIYTNVDTEIENSGIELALDVNTISRSDLRLDISGNVSFLKNNVSSLANDIRLGGVFGPGTTGETSSIYRSGESAGSFYMYRFLGYDENGVEKLSEEREIVGNALPDVTYGFGANLSYKKFTATLNFNGVAGVDIFNNTARAFSSAASLGQNGNNINKGYLDKNESPAQAPKTSSKYIESGDFLRLNNMTLAYNLSFDKTPWISNARLYVTGQNLWVLTDYKGYDPEVNSQGGNVYGIDYSAYPKARTFLLGVSVNF
jgi:iron complex outermembrane receptor protein